MKKITLMFFALISFWQINAQVSSYSFAAGTGGTLDPMTGSTQLVAASSDDGVSPVTAIGFTFNFAGVDYTQFSANSNGIVRLGATAVTSQWTNTAANVALTSPVVMAYWDDLATGVGGKVHYVLTGTAPNQKLIVEWFVTVPRNTTGAANAKIQCIFEEGTNVVKFVYGTGVVVNSLFTGYTVGLATSATLFNNVDTTTNTVSQSVFKIDNTVAIPDGTTYTWTPPTCPGSTGLTTTNLTANSATVTWTPPSSVPANGYEYVVSSSATPPTGSGTVEVSNTANVSALIANTTYYVYVRSICGADVGTWVSVGTFKTLCDEVTAFAQNFDSYPTGTTSLPDCWSKAGTSANVYINSGSAVPMSPANRLYMNVSTTTSAFAILAPVSNLQANTHRLKFKAYCTTASKQLSVGYFAIPGDVASYVELEPIQLPGTGTASAQEFTIIPTTIPAGVKQLVFNSTQPTPSTTTVYIDDVKWEVNSSCVEPSALTASAITNNSATLGWTNGGLETTWDIQYGPNNFPLGSGTFINGVTANPHVLGGLTANTTYQFYVRGVCTGPTNSSWSGPFTFKTQCDDVTSYFENFDSYVSGTNSLPDCWSRGGTSTSTYIGTGSVAPMSPSNRLYMFASGTAPTEGYAILPAVSNLQANTHRLKFKGFTTLAGRFIVVGYLTDPSDVNTFVQIEEIYLPSTVVANTQEFTVIPTGIPAGVKHLAIKNPGFPASSTTAYLDDIAWELIPACTNPTSASASAVTSNSALISWTSAATAVSWEIEYGAPGFTLGTGTVVPAATNPFTLTGLMPQTNYQYYVRSICAGPLTSTNSIPGSFLTACVPVSTLPWNENFDAVSPVGTTFFPPCWVKENGDWATATTSTYATPNSGANLLRDSWSAIDEYIWTPQFSLVAGTSYDFSSFVQGDNATGWVVDFFVNTAQSSAGATQLGATYNVPGTGTPYAANGYVNITRTFVPTTTGDYSFGIRVNQPSGSPWYVSFDDFQLKVTPVSAPGCATNLVAVPNSCGNFANALNWDAEPLASGYYINVGTTSGGTDIANNVDISSNTYSFTGTINTLYYWTVTPYNANGSATGCTEQSFTTSANGCYCPSVPTVLDGSGVTNVQLGTTNFPTAVVTYVDHSATSVTLPQGVNANVQVSFATGYTYDTHIWIDFNDNFTFDPSELVYSGNSSVTNPTVLNASFIMPAAAALGTHKMRIVTADVMPVGFEDPCYGGSYGVTLDFSVTITAPPSCIPPTTLTATAITANTANLGWTEAGTATVWDIEWGTIGFTPTGTPNIAATTTNPHNLAGLTANTAYGFYVRANCGGTAGESTWSGPFNFTTACDAANVPYVMDFEGATVPALPNCTSQQNVGTGNLWTVANNPGNGFINNTLRYGYSFSDAANVWFYTQGINLTAGTTYAIAFDYGSNSATYVEKLKVAYGTAANAAAMTNPIVDLSNIIDIVPVNSSTQFTPASTGVYYFGFNAYSDANAFNLFVDNINVDVFLNTNSFDNSSFVAYPNPVKDVLNLSYSSEISSVKVINLLGQEVISRKVNSTTSQIDMTSLTAGAYIVNVTIGDVVKTIKVIKQ